MYRILLSTPILAFALTANLQGQLPAIAEDISPLLIGESMPDISLTDLDGNSVPLTKIMADKPTVLIIYRGGWCPYCNLHLAGIGKIESEILKLGYQVVAVSPDEYNHLGQTVEKDSLGYRLFSDASGALIKASGVAFQVPEKFGPLMQERSARQNEGFMPVPSVFVLNTTGAIEFEYINPNYKERMSGDLLLAVLQTLSASGKQD